MASDIILAVGAGTLSAVMALVTLAALPFLGGWRYRRIGMDGGLEPMTFLFRKGKLIDATTPARALLDVLPGEDEWHRLSAWLALRLPECRDGFAAALADRGRAELTEGRGDGNAPLHARFEDLGDGVLRITLDDPAWEHAGSLVDSLTLAAMREEIGLLRGAMDSSPMLAWREDAQGVITWANSAYFRLAERQARDGEILWPLPRLIELPVRNLQPLSPRRAQITEDGHVHWFECHTRPLDGQTVVIALPADAAVKAERSLREFVQTLTKTFAGLPIGMAIFDRDRHLQLFNPALIDLTSLSASFLTARPTLYAFLDRLREARMVPEPKDYRSWRNQMNTLEKSAASGHHSETWTLPGGQTYRVSGRPHPDGAVAFLFEDITSEVMLTRKFRAELTQGKEALDALDDAIAVFGGNGQLAMSNRAYDVLWGDDIRDTVGAHLATWQESAGEGPGFSALRELLRTHVSDAASGAMAGPGGGLLSWSLRPLGGGRVMVRFAHSAPAAAPGGTPRKPAAARTDPTPAEPAMLGDPRL